MHKILNRLNFFLFDYKSSLIFVIFSLSLIFLPKINLINFAGRETAGIRIDDLFLLFFSFFLFWGHISAKHQLSSIEKKLFVILIFSFFSFFLNRFLVGMGLLHVDANILYVLRIFEYFIFYYAGFYTFRHFNLYKIIACYFVFNLILIFFQKAGLIGYWGIYGYKSTCTYRCAGIASFPSEMGMLLNMFFSFVLFEKEKFEKILRNFFCNHTFLYLILNKIYSLFFFILFAFLIFLNGSRIAFVAFIITYLFYLIKKSKVKTITIIAFFIFFSSSFIYVLNSKASQQLILIERSQKLFSKSNLELIEKVWDKIDVRYVPIGNEIVKQDLENEDTSWWIRIHKWLYGLKIYYLHPELYLFGIGPGFAMAGLDGGLLRIFIEYGVLGFFLFFLFFYDIAKQSITLCAWILVFIINMLFFDVYLAYKPMSLMFLLTGYTYAERLFIFSKSITNTADSFDKIKIRS